jgi:hypothetical protein
MERSAERPAAPFSGSSRGERGNSEGRTGGQWFVLILIKFFEVRSWSLELQSEVRVAGARVLSGGIKSDLLGEITASA